MLIWNEMTKPRLTKVILCPAVVTKFLSHSVGFSLNALDVVGSVKIDRTVTQVVQAERCVIDNNGLGNYTTE